MITMINQVRFHFLFAVLSFCIGATHLLPAQSFEEKYFQSKDVDIHYIDEGEGEPVLLIHGFASSLGQNWIQPGIADSLLNRGYRVIAYDTRGHGKSSTPHDPEQYGFPDIRDGIRLLDHLSVQRAHIVGYSRGGSIANAIRAFYPERCITVTLGGYGRAGQNLNHIERLPRDQVADSLASGNAGPLIRAVLPESQRLPLEQLKAMNRLLIQNHDQNALSAAFRAGPGYYTSSGELKINRVPTLALVGEYDPMKDTVDEMAKMMNKLTVVKIPGAGHMNMVNHPEFINHLLHFIARQD